MLILTNQTSSAIETQLEGPDSYPKKIHVVVKNAPFNVQIAFPETLKIDPALLRHWNFFTVSLSAKLAYDCPEMKTVDYVRVNPVEIKPRVSSTGDSVTLEVRVKVLSSQLEDMFFRILFQAIDNVTKEEIHGLSVFSEPIKVVSKFDQIKKNKDAVITHPQGCKTQPSSPSSPSSSGSNPPSPTHGRNNSSNSRKRGRASSVSSGSSSPDELAELPPAKRRCGRGFSSQPPASAAKTNPTTASAAATAAAAALPQNSEQVHSCLAEMQRQQHQQTRMLEKLLAQVASQRLNTSSSSLLTSSNSSLNTAAMASLMSGDELQLASKLSFETLLLEALNRYQELNSEERMCKIRIAMFSLSSSQAETLNSLFEDIRSENSSAYSSPGEIAENEQFYYVNPEWQPNATSLSIL